MAAVVCVDTINSLSAQEQFGLIVRLRRMAIVTKLLFEDDFKILDTALGAIGMPQPGSSPENHPNLVLVQRNPELVPGDKASVKVELIYELGPSDGQDLNASDKTFLGIMSTNISQVETNLANFNFDIDLGKLVFDPKPIKTIYTYPVDDPSEEFAGKIRSQGGTIGVFRAEKTWTGRGIKRASDPQKLQNNMLLHLNDSDFLAGEAKTWLCTAANYKPFEVLRKGDPDFISRWLWDFEFQFNPDGWNPGVVFIHEATKIIPSDLIKAVGFFNVPSYQEINFEEKLEVKILY